MKGADSESFFLFPSFFCAIDEYKRTPTQHRQQQREWRQKVSFLIIIRLNLFRNSFCSSSFGNDSRFSIFNGVFVSSRQPNNSPQKRMKQHIYSSYIQRNIPMNGFCWLVNTGEHDFDVNSSEQRTKLQSCCWMQTFSFEFSFQIS